VLFAKYSAAKEWHRTEVANLLCTTG